jgi:surfactin synthase thioesterase subunit
MTASPTPVPDIGRSPWFFRVVRKEDARARLLCLPFAGGGADFYRGWSDWLPPDLEMWPVQPPGRGARMMERPLDDLAAMVHSIAEAVTPLLNDLPVIVFGHSMGALLAFELAHELAARSAPAPKLLILSGRPAPAWRLPRIRHVMTDAELFEELRSFAGTPAEALNDPELMELMLPTIRADFKLVETYRQPRWTSPARTPDFRLLRRRGRARAGGVAERLARGDRDVGRHSAFSWRAFLFGGDRPRRFGAPFAA